MNPVTHAIGSEASVVVRAVVPQGADVAPRVLGVTEAYKVAYHQESVGVVTSEVCGVF